MLLKRNTARQQILSGRNFYPNVKIFIGNIHQSDEYVINTNENVKKSRKIYIFVEKNVIISYVYKERIMYKGN